MTPSDPKRNTRRDASPSAAEREFDRLYGALNERQREAVDAIDGPVMVIAGPGTGKTLTLTFRIANILRRTDTDPDSILALTFTDAAASEMRERLRAIIGNGAYRVAAFTFHGFCERVIERFPEEFPAMIGARLTNGIEQLRIVQENIETHPDLQLLRPSGDPLHHAFAVKGAIETLKKENIDAAELQTRVAAQQAELENAVDRYHVKGAHKGKETAAYRDRASDIKKNAELAILYAAYEQTLRDRRLYDYDDLLMSVVRALEQSDNLKQSLQEQYQYLLADEHQDANQAQNRLLELLCDFHPNPNLFIVGDDQQAIFRFQGASLENFLYFHRQYPSARRIVLQENYRSTPLIVEAAHSVIVNTAQDAEREAETPQAANASSGRSPHSTVPIGLWECSRHDVELLTLTTAVNEELGAGTPASEIAVLVRTNSEVVPVMEAMERADIPFVVESSLNIFASSLVRKIILLLRAVDAFGSDDLLVQSSFIDFLAIDPLDVVTVQQHARATKQSVAAVLSSPSAMDGLSLRSPSALRAHYDRLAQWRIAAAVEPMPALFGRVVEESGMLTSIITHPKTLSSLAVLHGFFDLLKELAAARDRYTLAEFLAHLDIIERHSMAARKQSFDAGYSDGVRLLTAHKAKGREFDVVLIAGAADGNWGGRRSRLFFRSLPIYPSSGTTPRDDDDERRLFYVALTRARRHIDIFFSRRTPDGRDRLPSRFIGEISPSLIERRDTSAAERLIAAWGGLRFSPRDGVTRSQENTPTTPTLENDLRGLFLHQGLSVTALNNYLQCPWQYFFRNLLRIPETPEPHQLYGTAAHAALKYLFSRLSRDEEVSREEFIGYFRMRLEAEWLASDSITPMLRRGEQHLGGYYDEYHPRWHTSTINEVSVSGVTMDIALEDGTDAAIPLRGSIDKIEILNAANDVVVVDYKTGAPKSRAFIEGATKGSSGDYKRQLAFYKFLLERSHSPYTMTAGEIDFVEPTNSGAYRKVKIAISESDVRELKKQICAVAREIATLAFWRRRCTDRSCRYCALQRMMGAIPTRSS